MFEGNNRIQQVPDVLEFRAGEDMKERTHFWVGIYNGENSPKNITELRQQKLAVKLHVGVFFFRYGFFPYGS